MTSAADRERLPAIIGEAPVKPQNALIREIAMDIGKAVVHHIETMYPKAIEACPSTFKLSVRNCVHNEIMAAIQFNDEGEIAARLQDRKRHRRKISAAYRKIRTGDS